MALAFIYLIVFVFLEKIIQSKERCNKTKKVLKKVSEWVCVSIVRIDRNKGSWFFTFVWWNFWASGESCCKWAVVRWSHWVRMALLPQLLLLLLLRLRSCSSSCCGWRSWRSRCRRAAGSCCSGCQRADRSCSVADWFHCDWSLHRLLLMQPWLCPCWDRRRSWWQAAPMAWRKQGAGALMRSN